MSTSEAAFSYPTVDIELARRLERAEGAANAAYVDARRELQPDLGAAWTEVAGVYAMFDGIASPLTQTFGLGIFEPFREREFDTVETFFRARGSPVFHEVCSFVRPKTKALLIARGYAPVEESTVLIRPTALPTASGGATITVREIEETEALLWSRVAAQGWSSESAELAAFVEQIGTIIARARGVHCFLAQLEHTPIAAGALNISNGVALLAGASTIPAARKRGAQLALLEARLAFAAAQGIDLAMVVTAPGNASQRNAERQDFRPAYSRTKWRLP